MAQRRRGVQTRRSKASSTTKSAPKTKSSAKTRPPRGKSKQTVSSEPSLTAGSIVACEVDGDWLDAEVIDAKPTDSSFFTAEHRQAKRKGHSSRRKSRSSLVDSSIAPSSWVLVAYQLPSGIRKEEWIHFVHDGPLCLFSSSSPPSPTSLSCFCSRHHSLEEEDQVNGNQNDEGIEQLKGEEGEDEDDDDDEEDYEDEGDEVDDEEEESSDESADEDHLSLAQLKELRERRKRKEESKPEDNEPRKRRKVVEQEEGVSGTRRSARKAAQHQEQESDDKNQDDSSHQEESKSSPQVVEREEGEEDKKVVEGNGEEDIQKTKKTKRGRRSPAPKSSGDEGSNGGSNHETAAVRRRSRRNSMLKEEEEEEKESEKEPSVQAQNNGAKTVQNTVQTPPQETESNEVVEKRPKRGKRSVNDEKQLQDAEKREGSEKDDEQEQEAQDEESQAQRRRPRTRSGSLAASQTDATPVQASNPTAPSVAAANAGAQDLQEETSHTGTKNEEKAGPKTPKKSGEKTQEKEVVPVVEVDDSEQQDMGIDLENFFPEKLVALQEAMRIPMAQLFREAQLKGGQMNSAYSWVRRTHLHRPAMQQAGRILAKWYRDNLHRAPPDFTPPEAPPPLHLLQANRPPSTVKKMKKGTRRGSSMGSMSGLLDEADGVRLGSESNKWEVFLPLLQGAKPIRVAEFEVADDAARSVTKAKEAAAARVRELLVDRSIAEIELNRQDTQQPYQCALCEQREFAATVPCTTCTRRFHMTCLTKKFVSMGLVRENEQSDDFSCPSCLKQILNAVRSALGLQLVGGDVNDDDMNGVFVVDRRRPRRRQTDADGGTSADLENMLIQSPYGQISDSSSAFSFPISASYIKSSVTHRQRAKGYRRKDGIDLSTNSQWVGEGFVDGSSRSRCRVFYPGFRFLDSPDQEYRILDQVLLFRLSPDGEEEEEEEDEEMEENTSDQQKAKKTSDPPEFYVGQIEALWEEPDGSRKARVAWFFWPSETQLGASLETDPDEVFSSNEVDIVALSSIAAKVKVVPYSEYVKLKESGTDSSWKHEKRRTRAGSAMGLEVREDSSTSMDGVESSSCFPPGSKDRRSSVKNAAGEEETKKLETGTVLRNRNKERVEQARRLLFARRHYHYRASKVVGGDHPSIEKGNALNPWMHSFLLATRDEPDSTHLLQPEDLTKEHICDYTLGIADTVSDPQLDSLSSVKSIDEILENAPACSFCFERLPFVGYVECAICTGAVICFECFSQGRQGMVKVSSHPSKKKDDKAMEVDEGQKEEHSVRLLHRSSHPYRMAKPKMDYSNPKIAIEALEWMCKHYGLLQPSFEVIGIVRGPLPSRETRGPSTRYRFAASFYCDSERAHKAKAHKSGAIGHVIGSRYGKSVEEAKGICAVDALFAIFGVSNKLNVPVLSSDWKAREALRLVDSLGIHSLAWELAEEVVGHKNALECSEFFSCYLHPAWASENEWAHELRRLVESNQSLAKEREKYIGNAPPPSADAVTRATKDAVEWGQKVHEMAVRRSKVSRRVNRGLAFAVVDGQTVFAARPDSFGPYVTSETEDILKMNVDPDKLAPDEKFLFEERRVIPAPSESTSSCVICKKNDRANTILLCDGCDSEYHISCLDPPLESVPDTDWFCSDCMKDREYLYDHTSWGNAGGTLVQLVKQNGVWVAKGEVGCPWQKRVREWQDNDKVIMNASYRAIQMGFAQVTGGSTAGRKPRVSTSFPAMSPTEDKRGRLGKDSSTSTEVRKRGRGRPPGGSGNGPHKKMRVSEYEESSSSSTSVTQGASVVLTSGEHVANQIAWATRHHACQTVAALEAANQGLAEALSQVLAQRDTLLKILQTRK